MTHNTAPSNSQPVSQNIKQEILRVINGIRYGLVEILIHAGQVVKIESREKIRVSPADYTHKVK
ncbi:hypothetical protein C8R30_10511 [Nitrosomonas nitrosa]|uniref:YezD family protein n=1 Tax=Nitrosomonas nitrosa TaxID=52442 RepID=UPI000D307336|nr:YezD family protein [Nitrosomonas nitrosa]PTR02753.1 hypothetical protein C8R30_10511 [Nitrosomonas nitrosa]